MSAPTRLVFDRWGEPNPRKIEQVVEILHRGGVAAYPTDSIYALGCALESREGIERIYRAKEMHKSQRLALICPDLSTASEYAILSQTAFRLAQRIFPGPYTLVVPATRQVPKTITDTKRRTVGIRVTSHPIAQALAKALGRPLLTTSAVVPETHEPCRDADEVLDVFAPHIDVVIDSEQTQAEPSTVIEVDGEDITLIRLGQGSIEGILDLVQMPEPETVVESKKHRYSRR
ncbi:MAG TPA: L-threonylcarbamoyladenylate synthase [Kofleriaceae bacterium]|nr:L-threonylcarbamoyladenylate synthase [Kofleriaceae bacterium]